MQWIGKERVLVAISASTLMAIALLPSVPRTPVQAEVPSPGTASVDVAFAAAAQAHASSEPLPAPHHTRPSVTDRTALIVAVAHTPGTTPIPGAIADAENIRTALLGYGFRPQNIEMLIDAQATRGAILGGLDSLAARTSSSGIAVFAIAGHSTSRSFAAFDGTRVSKYEFAAALGRVRGRVWSLFALCHAGAYDLPGTSGPGRVATFSSSASDVTFDGAGGSAFVEAMVVEGMIDQHAASSVEAAYGYARLLLGGTEIMDDGVPGELVLGPTSQPGRSTNRTSNPAAPAPSPGGSDPHGTLPWGKIPLHAAS